MKAAAWTATPGRLMLEDRPQPVAEAGEVVIQVSACGICGSDLHQFHGTMAFLPGLVPGHEIAGTVVDGGGHPPGTPVAVEPLLTCGTCPACLSGNAPRCASGVLLGMSRDGGMQERIAVPAQRVFALPPGTDPVLGSLVEPLAVCVRAVNVAGLSAASRVLIVGAGTIGLLTLLLAREIAADVSITARYDHQASAAVRFGATTVHRTDGPAPGGPLPDVVIETVGGSGASLAEALKVVRPGGRVVAVGVFASDAAAPVARLVVSEVSLVGSLMYGMRDGVSEFGTAARLIGRYAAELASLQTHRFQLEHCQQAFETAADKGSRSLKVTVTP